MHPRYFAKSGVGVGWLLCLVFPLRLAAQDVTFASLLHELVDRDSRAQLPAPFFTCRQFSSYDRDATSPENQETWYANADRSQFVRVEDSATGKQYVLMDTAGPGAIVRFWSTWDGAPREAF